MLLELQCIDLDRVRQGVEPGLHAFKTGWARRGVSGIRFKSEEELQHGYEVAAEIRLLQLPEDEDSFLRLLCSARWGADAIADMLAGRETPAVAQWRAFERKAAAALREQGLPDCNWGVGGEDGGIRRDVWMAFGKSLAGLRVDLGQFVVGGVEFA